MVISGCMSANFFCNKSRATLSEPPITISPYAHIPMAPTQLAVSAK